MQRLSHPNAHPSDISIDPHGIPFFCESGINRIGRIEPTDLSVIEFSLPEGSRPRRLTIASDDSIYYTDYHRGFLGQLNPKNGKVKEWSSPGGAKSTPYGIAMTSDGMVWYSESGTNPDVVVRFDPRSQKLARWFLPAGNGVRNMVAAPVGEIYMACSGSNTIGAVRIEK